MKLFILLTISFSIYANDYCKNKIYTLIDNKEKRYALFITMIYEKGLISSQQIKDHLQDLSEDNFINIFEGSEKSTYNHFSSIINAKYKDNITAKNIIQYIPKDLQKNINQQNKTINKSEELSILYDFIKVKADDELIKIYDDRLNLLKIKIDDDIQIMPLLVNNYQWASVMNQDIPVNMNSPKINNKYFEVKGYYELIDKTSGAFQKMHPKVSMINGIPMVSKRAYNFLTSDEKLLFEYTPGFIDKLNKLSHHDSPLIYKILPDHQKNDRYRLPYHPEWKYAVLMNKHINADNLEEYSDIYTKVTIKDSPNLMAGPEKEIELNISKLSHRLKNGTYQGLAGVSLGVGELTNDEIKTAFNFIENRTITISEYIELLKSPINNHKLIESYNTIVGKIPTQRARQILNIDHKDIELSTGSNSLQYNKLSGFRLVRYRP